LPGASKEHRYAATVRWTGDRGAGTSSYRAYGRDHEISAAEKPSIPGSSDPAFRGDGARWNPEDLLVSALSACHMLSYLHLCAVAGIVVTAYEDCAEGTMRETPDGGGRFEGVVLRPRVTIASGDPLEALRLHEEAHRLCFIASSVDFPVSCEPETIEGKDMNG
jgi:organic hydroperoxide reductase OsmC/OhrA